MIFVDTNVLMYAVGGEHPLRDDARAFFLRSTRDHLVWAVEEDDVRLARLLVEEYPALGARDLLHLACCRRRDVTRAKTFDRALASAFE